MYTISENGTVTNVITGRTYLDQDYYMRQKHDCVSIYMLKETEEPNIAAISKNPNYTYIRDSFNCIYKFNGSAFVESKHAIIWAHPYIKTILKGGEIFSFQPTHQLIYIDGYFYKDYYASPTDYNTLSCTFEHKFLDFTSIFPSRQFIMCDGVLVIKYDFNIFVAAPDFEFNSKDYVVACEANNDTCYIYEIITGKKMCKVTSAADIEWALKPFGFVKVYLESLSCKIKFNDPPSSGKIMMRNNSYITLSTNDKYTCGYEYYDVGLRTKPAVHSD